MNLEKLSEWIDPALAMRVMTEAGAESIEIGPTMFLGTYRPDGKTIRINPDADFDRIAEKLSPRFGFVLTRRDAVLLTVLHEAGHCRTDPKLLAESDPRELEDIADEYAVKRFLELRKEKDDLRRS